jgi:hypothetical protein
MVDTFKPAKSCYSVPIENNPDRLKAISDLKVTMPSFVRHLRFGLIFWALASTVAPAEPTAPQKAISIAESESGVPFILDAQGNVWGYADPNLLKGLEQLPGVNNVADVVPFAALTKDGKVMAWDMETVQLPASDQNTAYYSLPKILKNLSNAIKIAGTNGDYLVELRDGSVVRWQGNPHNSPEWITSQKAPFSVNDTPKLQELGRFDKIKSLYDGEDAAIILTEDGTAYIWGNVSFTTCDNDRPDWSRPHIVNVGADTVQVYVTDHIGTSWRPYPPGGLCYWGERYLAALSKNGSVRFWGGYNPAAPKGEQKHLNGWVDNVQNIAKIYPVADDMFLPSILLLRDGHAVEVLTPGGCSYCDPVSPQPRIKPITILPKAVTDIVPHYFAGSDSGTIGFIAVDANGKIWPVNEGYDPHPYRGP